MIKSPNIQQLLERIEYSGNGANVMEGLMLKHLEENETAITNLKDQIEQRKVAIKVLKNYRYNPKIQQVRFVNIATGPSTWTTAG